MPSKIAILSHVLPPSWSGQSMVLFRLLADWPADRYCLLSIRDYNRDDAEPNPDGLACAKLPANYHCVGEKHLFRYGRNLFVRLVKNPVNLVRETLRRANSIQAVVTEENCLCLAACSGDLIDIPAGYLAAKRLGIPFVVYMFDDYARVYQEPIQRRFAKAVWNRIALSQPVVIVPNEFLRRRYVRQYHLDPVVIANPLGEMPAEKKAFANRSTGLRVVYTGALYDAHYDAVVNLVEALKLIGPPAKLDIYTACSAENLRNHGICGPVTIHPHVPHAEAGRLQREADVLFLPLAFHSPFPRIIQTSAPGKMGEYLASGTPILVHAPADSFVSWYFRRNQCGIVVDREEPRLLAQALARLSEDAALCEQVTANARQCALKDFGLEQARERFQRVFEKWVPPTALAQAA